MNGPGEYALDRGGGAPPAPANPKDVAARAEGRVPMGLFPDTAVIAGAMAMHEGACKYGRGNYRAVGVQAAVYQDAQRRHMAAWWNGEDVDPDSGLPHLWKALACIVILIDAEACGKLIDDRPPRAPVAAMLTKLRADVARISEELAGHSPRHYTIADSE